VALSLLWLRRQDLGVAVRAGDLRFEKPRLAVLLKIGIPIAVQDGFVQIAFLVITAIANGRGVDVAAAVGIVEKIIGFVFLVPSAMLSTVSAMAAQNAGAGKHERGRQSLAYGILITVSVGLVVSLLCQVWAEPIVALFAKNSPQVVTMGGQYLRSYIFDCAIAGIHFCFSGYFCAYERSGLSFLHNLIAIVTVRIPGAYLASVLYPDTLFPMGVAAPAGSALSAVLCLVFFLVLRKRGAFD
jgi:Na+-driven multidrug efflux pump